MRRVAVIAAVEEELAPLVRRWTWVREGAARMWTGQLGEWTVVAACAGMGKEAARTALLAAVKAGPIDAVVSYGFAGALRADLPAGKALALSGSIDAATGARFPCARPSRAITLRGVGGSPAATAETQGADVPHVEATPSSLQRGLVPSGRGGDRSGEGAASTRSETWVVTCGDVAGVVRKRRLSLIDGAVVVDMEAAAVGAMAAERGISFYCLKGVTDALDDELPDFSRFIRPGGRFARGRFALHASVRPWLWRSLLRLSATSRTAALELSRLLGDTLRT